MPYKTTINLLFNDMWCHLFISVFQQTVVRVYYILKGCVCYILASLFLSLNKNTCQTRKDVFYFTSKALFILEKIKF